MILKGYLYGNSLAVICNAINLYKVQQVMLCYVNIPKNYLCNWKKLVKVHIIFWFCSLDQISNRWNTETPANQQSNNNDVGHINSLMKQNRCICRITESELIGKRTNLCQNCFQVNVKYAWMRKSTAKSWCILNESVLLQGLSSEKNAGTRWAQTFWNLIFSYFIFHFRITVSNGD